MMKILNSILLLIISSGATAESYAMSQADWCNEQWLVTSEKYKADEVADYQALLREWKLMEPRCKGTVVYEAMLALLYGGVGEYQAAREVLSSVDGVKSKYAYLAELVFLINNASKKSLEGEIDEQYLLQLEKKYGAFTRKYPNISEGYGELGVVQVDLGKYSEAVRNLEIGVQSQRQKWLIYRGLAISYAHVGRYEESYAAANAAMSFRNGLTSDPYFMCAVAIANAGRGKIIEAKRALLLIAAKRPEIKEDPEFRRAAQFVMSRDSEKK